MVRDGHMATVLRRALHNLLKTVLGFTRNKTVLLPCRNGHAFGTIATHPFWFRRSGNALYPLEQVAVHLGDLGFRFLRVLVVTGRASPPPVYAAQRSFAIALAVGFDPE